MFFLFNVVATVVDVVVLLWVTMMVLDVLRSSTVEQKLLKRPSKWHVDGHTGRYAYLCSKCVYDCYPRRSKSVCYHRAANFLFLVLFRKGFLMMKLLLSLPLSAFMEDPLL